MSTHTHTHNGLPAPSAQRIKFKLLISSQPLPMFSTYYKPPLIAVHPSSVFLLFFKHSSSLALQTLSLSHQSLSKPVRSWPAYQEQPPHARHYHIFCLFVLIFCLSLPPDCKLYERRDQVYLPFFFHIGHIFLNL